jgi:transcriptional regulator with XRE-family HTH domain
MVCTMSAIGQNVKRMRSAAGLTQQALAVAAGLSISAITQIEQGTNEDPRASTLSALARVLGVTVDDLLKVEEEQQPDPPAPAAKRGRRKKAP